MSKLNVDARLRCGISVDELSPECREGGLDRLEDLGRVRGRPHEDRRSALACWLVGVCKGDQSLVSGTLVMHHNQGDNN